jgi:hypothetical protein
MCQGEEHWECRWWQTSWDPINIWRVGGGGNFVDLTGQTRDYDKILLLSLVSRNFSLTLFLSRTTSPGHSRQTQKLFRILSIICGLICIYNFIVDISQISLFVNNISQDFANTWYRLSYFCWVVTKYFMANLANSTIIFYLLNLVRNSKCTTEYNLRKLNWWYFTQKIMKKCRFRENFACWEILQHNSNFASENCEYQ